MGDPIGGKTPLWKIPLVENPLGGKTPFFENLFSHFFITKSNFLKKKHVSPKSGNKIKLLKKNCSKIGGRPHWWEVPLVENPSGGNANQSTMLSADRVKNHAPTLQ